MKVAVIFIFALNCILVRSASIDVHAQPTDNKYERTLVLIKPDAVQRKLVGKIIERFENKGLTLVGMKLVLATEQILDEHYSQHRNRSFHAELIDSLTSGPLVAIVWEGPQSVHVVRKLLGNYNPLNSEPGSIRGDFSLDIIKNVVHGSDSIESANREIKLWFQEKDIIL